MTMTASGNTAICTCCHLSGIFRCFGSTKEDEISQTRKSLADRCGTQTRESLAVGHPGLYMWGGTSRPTYVGRDIQAYILVEGGVWGDRWTSSQC